MEKVLSIVDPEKKYSAISTNLSDRLRVTQYTLTSFLNNFHSGKIPGIVDKFNEEYSKNQAKIKEEEQKKANQAVISSIDISDDSPKLTKEGAHFLQVTSDFIAEERLKKLGVKILSPSYVEKIRKAANLTARKLLIQDIQHRIFAEIGKRGPKANLEKAEVVEDFGNWRGLFSLDAQSIEDLISDKEIVEDDRNKQKEEPLTTEAEISRRIMISKIAKQLEFVRSRMNKENGIESPFEEGLRKREEQLVRMLSDITGVNFSEREYEKALNSLKPETELQRIIGEQVGHRPLLTDEERKEKEKDLEDYYNDLGVQEALDRLKEMHGLMTVNNNLRDIEEAERVYNQQLVDKIIAEREKKPDTISLFTPEELLEGGQNQASIMFKEEQNSLALLKGSEEEARRLFKEARDFLEKKALVQAKMLIEEAYNNLIISGAEEQAKMLMDEAVSLFLEKGAEPQARELIDKEINKSIISGAEKQARLLFNETVSLLKDGALEQAKMLMDEGIRDLIRQGSVKQAQMLADEGIRLFIEIGSKPQAQEIIDKAYSEFIKNGAEEYAEKLYELSEAENLARKIYDSNKDYDSRVNAISAIVFERTAPVEVEEKIVISDNKNYHITDPNLSFPISIGGPKLIKVDFGQFGAIAEKANRTKKMSRKETLEYLKRELSRPSFLELDDTLIIDQGHQKVA